ncbi:MAG: TdeIII family type II restriction endonuclease [Gammaproteobacteria bacterium]|nr:TdeIII family type II restriction endonuclease [Gammaproteobacteria bacterium]
MLSAKVQEQVKEIIRECVVKKLESYSPETQHMPFHSRLIGQDRMALFSFIHSLNTSFGTKIFEPIAHLIAETNFRAIREYEVGTQISSQAQIVIQDILNELSMKATAPDKCADIKRIRSVCQSGKMKSLKPVRADLFLENQSGSVYLCDIKTAKSNIGGFKDIKRTLLDWVAIYLLKNPEADIHSFAGIPYNPYEPKPYQRWTLQSTIDIEHELKVAEEFWNFIGCGDIYVDLLDCFRVEGVELNLEINNRFRSLSLSMF